MIYSFILGLKSFNCFMRKIFLSITITLFYTPFYGQGIDTSANHNLKTFTVTAYKEKPYNQTSLNIEALNIDSLSLYGNYNLTDMMAKTPGVEMLSTGVSISKPVIRGLYGNRVLVLLSGLKFDNQQWQEEHGLGLSDFGLSKVELIKGPMSVLYGSEAMGGIINLIEEDKPEINTQQSDFSVKLNSNTGGGLLQEGYKANYGNKWWRIRVGVENNADYTDGNGNRVLNSRFDGYYVKTSYGFHRKSWTSTNNFMSSFNRFGFIFNDIYTFITPDDRWSRSLSINPAHLVLLNILSSENKFLLKNDSKLTLNLGVQSNERMENEGGGAISLNMHLLTLQYLLKWEKQLSENNRLIISNLGSFEDNTNFGARKIVPDARMQESNISVFIESTFNRKFVLENGAGIGEKYIITYFTPSVNSPEKDIHPFTKYSPYYNFYTGFSFYPSKGFNIKANAATGVRIPNLAELSSNGLHEGVFTYEIGDPLMKNEQNLSFNLYINSLTRFIDLSVSPFYNLFYNYVYLTPTTEDWFGFPVYRFKQQNATQYGTEVSFYIKPVSRFSFGASYSGIISKTADGNYTPFVPAQKVSPGINCSFPLKNNNKLSLYSNADYYFEQLHVAPNEIATPSYWLLNAGVSATFKKEKTTYIISIAGNNLLNEAYYDHLSRFKYFGLLNIGRNINLNFIVKFGGQIKKLNASKK